MEEKEKATYINNHPWGKTQWVLHFMIYSYTSLESLVQEMELSEDLVDIADLTLIGECMNNALNLMSEISSVLIKESVFSHSKSRDLDASMIIMFRVGQKLLAERARRRIDYLILQSELASGEFGMGR